MCCEICNFSWILGSQVFMSHPKKPRLSWILVLVLDKLSNPIQSWMVGMITKNGRLTKQGERSGHTNTIPLIPFRFEDEHDDEGRGRFGCGLRRELSRALRRVMSNAGY